MQITSARVACDGSKFINLGKKFKEINAPWSCDCVKASVWADFDALCVRVVVLDDEVARVPLRVLLPVETDYAVPMFNTTEARAEPEDAGRAREPPCCTWMCTGVPGATVSCSGALMVLCCCAA